MPRFSSQASASNGYVGPTSMAQASSYVNPPVANGYPADGYCLPAPANGYNVDGYCVPAPPNGCAANGYCLPAPAGAGLASSSSGRDASKVVPPDGDDTNEVHHVITTLLPRHLEANGYGLTPASVNVDVPSSSSGADASKVLVPSIDTRDVGYRHDATPPPTAVEDRITRWQRAARYRLDEWWPKRRRLDSLTAAPLLRLGFLVIVNSFAASSLLAALVLQPAHLFAAGLAFVLGWLGCYALMMELECRRLRSSAAEKPCNGSISTHVDSSAAALRTLVRPGHNADLDLSGYADVQGIILPETNATTPTADAVFSTALVSEYLRCTATLKKYQAKYGPLPRGFE